MLDHRIEVTTMACVDMNYAIGYEQNLLYKFSEDMKYFKTFTMGQIVIMGRKTFESMGSKPLPGRINVVLSGKVTRPMFSLSDKTPVFTLYDLNVALNQKTLQLFVEISNNELEKIFGNCAEKFNPNEAVVIGGSAIYNQSITKDLVDKFRLTMVCENYEKVTGVKPTHYFPAPYPSEIMNFKEGPKMYASKYKRYDAKLKEYFIENNSEKSLEYKFITGEYLK